MFHLERGESVQEEGLRMGKDEVHIEGDVGWDLGFEGGPAFYGRRSTLTLVSPLAVPEQPIMHDPFCPCAWICLAQVSIVVERLTKNEHCHPVTTSLKQEPVRITRK